MVRACVCARAHLCVCVCVRARTHVCVAEREGNWTSAVLEAKLPVTLLLVDTPPTNLIRELLLLTSILPSDLEFLTLLLIHSTSY